MSDADMPPPPSEAPPPVPMPPPPPRSGCMTAFMVIAGIILLLPGVCALGFGVATLADPSAAGIMPLVLLGLLVGFFGVVLIVAAIRGRRR